MAINGITTGELRRFVIDSFLKKADVPEGDPLVLKQANILADHVAFSMTKALQGGLKSSGGDHH